jgi:hypothetical protein
VECMSNRRDRRDAADLPLDTEVTVMRYDEGRAIAERLDAIDDDSKKVGFDDVFAEYDERFGDE